MPKDIKYFRSFEKGLITNIDPADLPDNAVGDGSKNFFINSLGQIEPVNDISSTAISTQLINRSGWYVDVDGKKCLACSTSSPTAGIITDFYGTQSASTIGMTATDNPVIYNTTTRFPRGTSYLPYSFYYTPALRFCPKKFTPNGHSGGDVIEVDSSNANGIGDYEVDITSTNSATETGVAITVDTTNAPELIMELSYTASIYSPSVGDDVKVANASFSWTEHDNTGTDTLDGTYAVTSVDTGTSKFKVTIYNENYIYCDTAATTADYVKLGDLKYTITIDGSTASAATGAIAYRWIDGGHGSKFRFTDLERSSVGDNYKIYTQDLQTLSLTNDQLDFETDITNANMTLVTSEGSSSATGGFDTSTRYYYGYSFTYDGLEESYIKWQFLDSIVPSATLSSINLVLSIPDTTEVNTRITAINIWRATGKVSEHVPNTYFRLVTTLNPLNDFSWTDSSIAVQKSFSDTGTVTASYEATTGIPDNITELTPKYIYAAQLNGYLYVAKVNHSDISPNDQNMVLLRSKLYAYDIFDVTKDILKLPFEPTAIIPYRGKLIVFGDSQIAQVNPNLYIEDIYQGRGTIDSRTVVITPIGLVFADSDGMYIYDTNQEEVSFPIKDSWVTPVSLHVDKEKRSIVVTTTSSSQFMFSLVHKSWALFDDSITFAYGFSGYTSGETYFVDGAKGIYRAFTGTGLNMVIVKPVFLGSPQESKKYYNCYTDCTSLPTQEYSTDGTTYTTISSNEIKTATGKWVQAKKLWLRIMSKYAIKSIGVKYRSLLGKVRTEITT